MAFTIPGKPRSTSASRDEEAASPTDHGIPGLRSNDWQEPPRAAEPRISYSLQGETKTWKSSFPLSGPSPQVALDLDDRLAGVVDWWLDGPSPYAHPPKRIVRIALRLPKVSLRVSKETAQADPAILAAAKKEWTRFVERFYEAGESSHTPGGVRLMMIDDATSLVDLRLMSEFGRLVSIPAIARGDANIELGTLMRESQKFACSVVWIHELKDEYKTVKKQRYDQRAGGMITVEEGEATGKRILDGYKKAHYAVQVMLETVTLPRDPTQFGIRVINSGLNSATNGVTYTAEDWGEYGPFAWISAEQLPQFSPMDFMDKKVKRNRAAAADED